MAKQTQTPPIKDKAHINPLLALLILLAVILAALMAVKRAARTPAPAFAPPAATGPSDIQAGGQTPKPTDRPTVSGTVTFIKDNALTVMARKADNPGIANDRVLIVSLISSTVIENGSGKALAAKDLKAGAAIKVYNAAPFKEDVVLFADKVVMTK